ncbi:uncharacterized protein PHALS_10787 [Plasmopara halstedii]|uniref:Uncharacterized protein n=1 Tax=Plasmopara halstedii TaxID=4781 RepID=A0A0P1AI96_PLAHL|nr:uncharacterized protein PHALS_10787 [Plasmopara halstedii]CEG40600.1 hypothetical protein PHALS_10787 [Plasmopara halstedii]|eukprot:XP_024576969.1 hypothetical protein PHALS_10787 [Plasmopara halstedii]
MWAQAHLSKTHALPKRETFTRNLESDAIVTLRRTPGTDDLVALAMMAYLP